MVLATHNLGKIAELRPMLEDAGLDVVDAVSLGLVASGETGRDFRENASAKARAVARAVTLPALADDSGFCVAALGGDPGLRSARWAAELGGYSNAMDAICARAVHSPDRRASFVCVLAVAWPDGGLLTFEGEVAGCWTWPPRGRSGFGYDAMFIPERAVKTFAEMSAEEKAVRSHRTRAFQLFTKECLP